MSYFNFIKSAYRVISLIIILFYTSNAYAFRGPSGGPVSDTTVFLVSIILIILFTYSFWTSSGFRKSVFHGLFFVGFVIVLPLSLFAGDRKNWEMGILVIPIMFFVHKFLYFILDRNKDDSKNPDNSYANKHINTNSSRFSGDLKNIDRGNAPFVNNSSKVDHGKKHYKEEVGENINLPFNQPPAKPVKIKSIKEINESSNNSFNYVNYLSESFPSKKPFFSSPEKIDKNIKKEQEDVSSNVKGSKKDNITDADVLAIRNNQAKALFVIKIHREVTGILIKDEMLWHACMLETKNDFNSATLLYKIAREKFVSKLNFEFINDRLGLDVVDANLNYRFCTSQAEANKLAYTS